MMLRCRKGVSIVEVVIALVIISIVSAAALSMVIMSAKVDTKVIATVEVSESVDNAIDCFRFSENKDEFFEALNKTALYEQDPEREDRFILKAVGFTATILVSGDQFAYTAVDNDGEEIYSFTYTKSSALVVGAQVGEGGGES